jgi:hypothetical protein
MVIDILFKGVGWTDIALTLDRVAVGMFFMFSGYHKLFNAQRHRAMLQRSGLTNGGCHRSNSPPAAPSSSDSLRPSPRSACL